MASNAACWNVAGCCLHPVGTDPRVLIAHPRAGPSAAAAVCIQSPSDSRAKRSVRSATRRFRPATVAARSGYAERGWGEKEDGDDDVEAAKRRLESSVAAKPRISGRQLRELVVRKFGRPYDTRLTKINNRIYFQVMWRFLGQRSFHLTEEMYDEQLEAVAEYLTHWGIADSFQEMLLTTRQRPGFTGGGGAKAVSIPLNISSGDGRGQEWLNTF